METIQFSEDDAMILYCIPARNGNVKSILNFYFSIHRAAPPPYSRFVDCISKALAAGIVTVQNDSIKIRDDWFQRINVRQDDELSQLNELLLNKNWPAVCRETYEFDEAQYEQLAKEANSFSKDQSVKKILERWEAREVGLRQALGGWAETPAGLILLICIVMLIATLLMLTVNIFF